MNNAFSLTKIIGGLSKTLNVVNQLIPLYNQVKPYLGKASKLMNNINNFSLSQTNTPKTNQVENNQIPNNLPTFFQ